MTLVLTPTEAPVRSLWAVMDSTEVQIARAALGEREDIKPQHQESGIGSWSVGEPSPELIVGLPEWALSRAVHHVVWTALSPKFPGKNPIPTMEEVVDYLGGLTGAQRDNAQRYIRFAPKQIDTKYRRRIESALHWTAKESPP